MPRKRARRQADGLLLPVELLAQLFAGLEEGDAFLGDIHRGTGPRIAPGARAPALDRERAEAAQLYPVAARQGTGDFVEDRRNDPFDVTLVEMRIQLGQPEDQFGFGHRDRPTLTLFVRPPRGRRRPPRLSGA